MTVDELIGDLAGLPGDTRIIMSSDGEGNHFSPMMEFSHGYYDPETPYHGEMTDDPDDERVLVFWPVA